jgi:hypothetical protein
MKGASPEYNPKKPSSFVIFCPSLATAIKSRKWYIKVSDTLLCFFQNLQNRILSNKFKPPPFYLENGHKRFLLLR